MTFRRQAPILAFEALVLVASCTKEPSAPTPPPAQQPAAPAPQPAAKSDPVCVGPVTKGTPQSLTIHGASWVLEGSTLSLKSPAKGKELAVGVISDIKEDSEENKENLKKLVAWFDKERVDLVVVAGDTGENQAQIEGGLDVVADVKAPVLSIIGNREPKDAYQAALTAVGRRHGNVLDLNTIRRVDTPEADFVSMPGYFNPAYLHANEKGCRYYPEDVDALGDIVKACDSPVVLISHSPPKQDGPKALDRNAEGGNVGDPALSALIAKYNVPFGIFGHIHEAGGKATDASGKELRKPGAYVESLYLNAGPADAVRWAMNDGTESVGMGALVRFKAGKASYTIHRFSDQPSKTAHHEGKTKQRAR